MILVTGLDWFLSAVNLYLMVGNLLALWGWAIYIFTQFVMNAFWLWDQEAQKKRTDNAKRSAKYIVLSLIVIDLLFGAIHLLNLDDAADSSNSTVSDFLQKWADSIDNWNYNMKVGDNSNSDYKNTNWWDALNFWE
jgi:putative flippase GtrA